MEEKISAGYSTQKLPDGPTSQSMYGRCYRCGDMGPYEYGIIYVRMCIDDVWKSVPVCARCWNKYHASDAGITSRQIAVKEHNKFVAGWKKEREQAQESTPQIAPFMSPFVAIVLGGLAELLADESECWPITDKDGRVIGCKEHGMIED